MPGPLGFRTLTGKYNLNPALVGIKPGPDSLHRANYVKEIFFDSDTVMACISGAAIGPPKAWVLPSEEMANTRNFVNELAGSRRMLCHGIGTPSNPAWIDDAERQVKELKIDAWKFYTGDPAGPWRHDDEKVAYPFYERSLKLGVRNICTHKGLPIPGPGKDFFRPDDIVKAAKDWPDINWIIFHSGMKHMMTQVPPGESGIDADGNIPWTTEFCRQIRESGVKNIYLELGAVFGHSVVTHPEVCGHLLRQVIAGGRRGPRDLGNGLHLVGLSPVAESTPSRASRFPTPSSRGLASGSSSGHDRGEDLWPEQCAVFTST